MQLGINLTFPWNANNCFVWTSYYYIGLAICNKPELRIKISEMTWTKITIVYVGIYIINILEGNYWFNIGNFDMATSQIRISSNLLSMVYIVMAVKYLNKQRKSPTYNKYLIMIGDYSYGIYLSHMLILSGLEYICRITNFDINTVGLIVLCISCDILFFEVSKMCFNKLYYLSRTY